GVYVRRLTSGRDAPAATAAAKRLEILLLCECLHGHSHAYLRERPSWERVAETVQRLTEFVWDRFDRPLVPMGVVVAAGTALGVRAATVPERLCRDPPEALTARLADCVQSMLDRLVADGPPTAWRIPVGAWGDPQA